MFPGRGRPPYKPLLPPRPGQSWKIQLPQGGPVEDQAELEDLKDLELSTQWSQTNDDEYAGIDLSETYWTQENLTGAGQDESPGHPLFSSTPHNKMMTKSQISWQEPNQESKGRPNPFTTPQYPTKQCNPQGGPGRGAPSTSFRFLHPGLGGSFALEEKTRETIVLKSNIGKLQKLLQNMTKKNYGLMNENLMLQETMTNSTKLFYEEIEMREQVHKRELKEKEQKISKMMGEIKELKEQMSGIHVQV